MLGAVVLWEPQCVSRGGLSVCFAKKVNETRFLWRGGFLFLTSSYAPFRGFLYTHLHILSYTTMMHVTKESTTAVTREREMERPSLGNC